MKKLKMMIVAVAVALVFAACGSTNEVPLEVVGSVPPDTITALETMPTETRYQFGDIVYTLERWTDGTVHVCRQAVVSHEGDVIVATSAISDTAEALRKCLPEYLESGYADMWVIDADECYHSEAAAQEAAEELMSGR